MRAKIVSDLEQLQRNSWLHSLREFLDQNRFSGNIKIVEFLSNVFIQVLSGKSILHFDELLTEPVKEKLNEGDAFFVNLFRDNGYITEHTADKESLHPLTDASVSIFNELVKEKTAYDETLSIYGELRRLLETEIGALIACDPALQHYEVWKVIHEKLKNRYQVFDSWQRNIPVGSIHKEKSKLGIAESAKLADLAEIRGHRRSNEQDAEDYMAKLKHGKPDFSIEYLQEVTRGSDQLHFKDDIYFRQHLLHRSGINEWVVLLDSLKYPILQDHLFFYIDSIGDHVEIIRGINQSISLTTPKAHLLFIALENYFDFVNRTITDLYGLYYHVKEDNNSGQSKAITVAHLEYDRWLQSEIPDSFTEILNIVFPDKALERSPYFLDFFDWINSHSYLNLTHPINDAKTKLIDLTNDLFLSRLKALPSSRHYLIDNLNAERINYEGLKLLVTVLEEFNTDHLFRDKLFGVYKKFIDRPKFSWYAEGNINFNASLNNTYHFSVLLNDFTDGLKEWLTMYNAKKIVHEGWQSSPSNIYDYQRESFLLCAGVGLAHNCYQKGDERKGKIILWDVLPILIKQIRICRYSKIIDYATPIKFAAITIGTYDPKEVEKFLETVINKLDQLKYTLVAVALVFQSANDSSIIPISENLKRTIKEKIQREFWVIEQRKSEALLAHELNYYKQLRQICEESLS